MQPPRSAEYRKLVLDIFLLSVEEIEAELRYLYIRGAEPTEIFCADITYGEYFFLLLTERDFKVAYMKSASGLTDEIAFFLSQA